MKTLYLLRHAKAASSHPSGDHARPLNEQGREAASQLGETMRVKKWIPDYMLCSDAARTRDTLECLTASGNLNAEPAFSNDLYLATPGDLLEQVHHLPATRQSALMIGHNPGFHLLAQMLAGKGDATLLEKLQHKFSTCTLAVLTFDTANWQDITPGTGTLTVYYRPDVTGE